MGSSRTKTKKVLLQYEVDDKTLKEADAAAARLLDGIMALGNAERQSGRESKAYADALREVTGREKELATVGKAISETVDEQEKQFKQAARAADDYGDAYRRASQQVEQFGDVATNISQISGLLRGVGLGGVADVGMIGADVADAIEGIRRLQPALQGVGQTIADIIPGISSATAGLGALGVAGLAVAAAATAAAIAFDAMKKANEAAVETVQAWINATNEYNANPPADLQEARANVEAWNQEITDNADRIALLQQSYETATEGMGVVARVADAINWNGVRTLKEEIERLEAASAKNAIKIAEARSEFGLAVDGFVVVTDELGNIISTTKALIDTEAALEAKRREQIETAERNAAAQAEYQAELEAQAQRGRDTSLAALDAQRAVTRFNDELRAIGDTSAQEDQFTTATEQKIESLTKTFDKFVSDSEKRISDINAKLQTDLAGAARDFMSAGVAATQKYLEQERKLQEDYNRDRIRLIQDMNDDLLSAEEDNDVIRFIRAQREGEKRISRLDEDASVESRRRSEEFQAEQKERRKEYQQRILDLRAAAQERINAEREKIAERRVLLQQQIADERAALVQQINDARTAALAMIQTRREQYIRELAELQAYNQARAAINANYLKQIASAAKAAMSYTAPNYKTGQYTPTAANLTSTYSSPYVKSVAGTTINIGNIGSDLSISQVRQAILSAFVQNQSAIAKAYK